ncbi:MAG TPA: TonB-dependent receptor plug domain-containing protein, partial [Bryobacteraceae bacterium]|nr:TonB-dependent receptor plug domain-containing protein [Bryobacteraceae bacterium]
MTLPLGVILLILFALFSAGSLCSEEPRRDVIVVTGTFDPVPLEESERPVTVLDIARLRLVSNSLASLLRLEPSLDVRERSPNGVQADVSIRGSTFGQTLVLLNGL